MISPLRFKVGQQTFEGLAESINLTPEAINLRLLIFDSTVGILRKFGLSVLAGLLILFKFHLRFLFLSIHRLLELFEFSLKIVILVGFVSRILVPCNNLITLLYILCTSLMTVSSSSS